MKYYAFTRKHQFSFQNSFFFLSTQLLRKAVGMIYLNFSTVLLHILTISLLLKFKIGLDYNNSQICNLLSSDNIRVYLLNGLVLTKQNLNGWQWALLWTLIYSISKKKVSSVKITLWSKMNIGGQEEEITWVIQSGI